MFEVALIGKRGVTLKEYVSAACLANVPPWILLLILSYLIFEGEILFFTALYYIAILGGAILAGYLIAGKVTGGYVKTGITTGLFSYVVNTVTMAFQFGNISFLFAGHLGELFVILIFVLGSSLGSLLRVR